MGLGTSLTTAMSGLNASQQAIAVLAQNIANANNPDYTRQVVSQSAVPGNGQAGNGVRLDEVTRVTDSFISKTVINRTSKTATASTIDSYYQQTQILFGQPGASNSLDAYAQKFFNSLNTLSVSQSSATKFEAVSAGSTLTREVSNLASGIENLRFLADGEIAESANRANQSINRIFDLNQAIVSSSSLGQSTNTLVDEVETEIKKLSQEIDVQYYYDDSGRLSLSAGGGISLIDGSNHYNLSYSPAPSVDYLTDNVPSGTLSAKRVNTDGSLVENSTNIISTSGVKDQITTTLTSGKIVGLQQMRDQVLPAILEQLDQFAATIRDKINAVHNDGVSYPPPTSLTGTTLIEPSAAHYWSGSVRIAALQANGQPVGEQALELNLGALSENGGVAGYVSFQGIINEINQFYNAPQKKVSIGDIDNIELVAKSDSLTAGTGSFNFQLETTNLSETSPSYTITGVTVSDPNIVVTSPATFPTSASTSNAGKVELGGTSFSLNMSSGAIAAGPYTVSIGVSVSDGNGGFLTDTITYVINERSSGLSNDRHAASSVSGSGDATTTSASSNQATLVAKLVDKNGVEISKNADGEYIEAGYLKIEGVGTNRVGIAELDSQERGSSQTGVNKTDYGFSHYFGLNNFFLTGDGTNGSGTEGAALTFRVRDDIAQTPSGMSIGKLQQSSESNGATRYSYEVNSGNNLAILDLADIANQRYVFIAAGGLGELEVSISNYSAQILGYNASQAAEAGTNLNKEQVILAGFEDKKNSISGVNIDEEIANSVIYQNAYAANARVISVINQMFDDLLKTF